jgi:hypothetical protein
MRPYMGTVLLQPGMEELLEWVLLLSLATSGLCVLALVVMMFVGRWRHAIHQRERNKRRGVLSNDIRDLEAIRLANSQAAEGDRKQLPPDAEERQAVAIERPTGKAGKA